MSFSDFRRARSLAKREPENAPAAHPLDGLARRLSEAGPPAPDRSPRRDLEQLVSMLAKRNIQTDGRLTNALEGLARWTDRAEPAVRPQKNVDVPEADAPKAEALETEALEKAPEPAEPQADDRGTTWDLALEETPKSAEPSAEDHGTTWDLARDEASKPAASPAEPKGLPGDGEDVEQRLDALARSLMDTTADVTRSAPAKAPLVVPQAAHSPVQPVASLRAALAQIAARQQALDEADAAEAAALASRRAPDGWAEPSAAAVDPRAVAGLKREIEKLGRAVSGLPTRSDVDGLMKSMAARATRDAAARPSRLDPETVRALDALISEVERMRGDAASPETVARFADELSAMSAKLEAAGPTSASALAALSGHVEDVRAELSHFPKAWAVENLTKDVQALVARLDRQELAAAEARVAEPQRLEAALRAELASFSASNGIDGVNRKLDALAEQLEARNAAHDGQAVEGKIDTLTGKVDALAAATLTRTADVERVADVVRSELAMLAKPEGVTEISRKIEALTVELAKRPQNSVDLTAVTGEITGLGAKFDIAAAEGRARGAAFDRIEDAVRGIAEHLVVTSQARRAAPEVLGDVESGIARLVDSLDRSDGRIDDLNAGFAALAARIEQSNAGIGAEAGRSAAAAVRESFVEQGGAGGIDATDLAEALSELRASAARNDRRTIDTLDAVRVTLERLVDRLDADGPSAERPAIVIDRDALDDRPMTAPAPAVDVASAARAAARRAFEDVKSEEDAASSRAGATSRGSLDAFAPDQPAPLGAPRLRPMSEPEAPPAAKAASFIAAARRATIQPSNDDDALAAPRPAVQSAQSALNTALAVAKARRKPLLLALAAALIVLGIVKFASGLNQAPVEMAPEPTSRSETTPAPETPAVAAPAPTAAPEPSGSEPAAPPAPATAPNAEKAPDASPPAPAATPPASSAPEVPPAAAPAAPKPGAELTPPRAAAPDMTDFAFSQTTDASARPFKAPSGDAEITTGSVARGSDALPESIGGSMLRMRAVEGDPSAQLEIADRLAEGRGVPADPAAAARWLEKAAAQGLAPAQHRLGSLYEKGRGVARDVTAARRWYEQAAAAGNVRSMHNLGVIHAEGGLGKPDFTAATVWFRMAAERGLVDSQYNLAVLEARGLTGKRDLAGAYKWFALATAQGDQDAGKKRDEVAKALGAKLPEAERAVADFRPRAVDDSANEAPTPAGGWDQASAPSDPAALR